MRNIGIVGGGQSGLQLGVALLRDGHEVTIYTDRTAEQWVSSRLPSSALLFGRSLDYERSLGIQFWDGEEPVLETTTVRIAGPDGSVALQWRGRFFQFAQAVDQRLKFPVWMGVIERLGGKIEIAKVDAATLDRIAGQHELTILAAGKGDVAALFEIDRERMTYDRPQRVIGMCAVRGTHDFPPNEFLANYCPGVGEAFGVPSITVGGAGYIWVLEGVPGGPMDCWSGVSTPDEHLKTTMRILQTHFPWIAERYEAVELTDDHAFLSGSVPPLVRKPIAHLPSGRAVVGMADVVVLNDPCTAQGSNNAAYHANLIHRLIREQGERPFDEPFMQRTFDEYWEYAQWPTIFTNAMMAPLPDHVVTLLAAAAEFPDIANRFLAAFGDPSDLQHWAFDPQKAQGYLDEVRASREALAQDMHKLVGRVSVTAG